VYETQTLKDLTKPLGTARDMRSFCVFDNTVISMDAIAIRPELKAQLSEYAQRHRQDLTAALDEALGAYFEWERADYSEAVEGIREGYKTC
jgi:hypothetical protein